MTHCKENHIYVFLFWELRRLSPNFHIHVSVSDLYISRIGPHISCSRIGRPNLEIYKSLTDIWVYRNWETEYYNSVLEITVSFLGIHNWEPDIYIGFSPALHLQCGVPAVGIASCGMCLIFGSQVLKVESETELSSPPPTHWFIQHSMQHGHSER
jgi:hypothetical protein